MIRFSLDQEDHPIDWPYLLSPGREGNPGEVERELTGFPQSSQLVLRKKELRGKKMTAYISSPFSEEQPIIGPRQPMSPFS